MTVGVSPAEAIDMVHPERGRDVPEGAGQKGTEPVLDEGGAMVVVEALNRAAAVVRHHVEHEVLRGADLSWTGYAVLDLICRQRSVETRAAAAGIGISRGTLTGVVHTLESKGLLRRMPHCRDGRLVLLEPTTAGRRLARRLGPRVRTAEDLAVGSLNARERALLAGMLGRVIADHGPAGADGKVGVTLG